MRSKPSWRITTVGVSAAALAFPGVWLLPHRPASGQETPRTEVVVAQAKKAGTPSPLPEGDTGIAAKYPGDAGIEKDPAVLFYDGFEDCSKPADLRQKWDEVIDDRNMRITEGAANRNNGKRAVEFAAPQQEAGLSIGLHRVLKDERDVLFLRWYSKFEKGFDVPLGNSCHNGGMICAHYYVGGRATPGQRADGRNKFLANFENETGWRDDKTPSPGHLNIYCYHPEQFDVWGDHFFPSGTVIPGSYTRSGRATFGDHFVAQPDVLIELDRWYCFEFMVKANTPGQRDGRIACWLDGKLIADFLNLRLRDVETLKIDRFDVGVYIGKNALRANKKWYDDVVAATSYIGPLKAR